MTTSTIKRRRSPSAKTPPPETSTTNGDNSMTSSVGSVISKTDSQESDNVNWDAVGSTYINPFIHRVNIDNNVELAKVSNIDFFLLYYYIQNKFLSLLSDFFLKYLNIGL